MVVVVALVLGGLIAWWIHATNGPGYNSDQAATSLRSALIKRHPELRRAGLKVHCNGIRDGANFFGCPLSLRNGPRVGYSVGYGQDRYTARGTYKRTGSFEEFSFAPK